MGKVIGCFAKPYSSALKPQHAQHCTLGAIWSLADSACRHKTKLARAKVLRHVGSFAGGLQSLPVESDLLRMAASLTPDAVGMILEGNLDLKPVVQCTGVTNLPVLQFVYLKCETTRVCTGVKIMQSSSATANGANERYKLAISDGRHWCTAMLATQLNDLARTNQIHNNTILRLDDYLSNAVQGKKYATQFDYCCEPALHIHFPTLGFQLQ